MFYELMTAKEVRQHIRAFMQAHYTDERLTWLLAHARAGKLAYNSCCCFIGVATADHALQGVNLLSSMLSLESPKVDTTHLHLAKRLPGAQQAENAYSQLGSYDSRLGGLVCYGDDQRRRILIPMILAEMRRRSKLLLVGTEIHLPELSELTEA